MRRAPFSSLRTQLPLLAAALVTLVVAVYCIAAYHEMRTAAVERERSRLLLVARELADVSAAGVQRRAGAADARAAIGSALNLAYAPGVEEQIRQLAGQDVAVYFTNHGRDVWTDLRGHPVAAPFQLRDTSPGFAVSLADGTPVFAARADVASTPWTIILARPQAVVLERPREFLQWMVTVGTLLLLLGVGGAWMLGRHVAQPLEALTRMERLQAATAALARALDWPMIASVFRCEGLALSGANAGGFYHLSPDGQWLEPLRPDARASGAASRNGRIEVGRVSFIHDAVRRGVPVYLASAADGKDQVDQPLELPVLDGRAWAVLPLKVRGGVHGILILAFAEPQDFPAGLRGSLEALATQCSQATERILVYEEAVDARWAAEAANRAKSQFLAMMSHELRTPLNAIGGYAELMDLGLRGPVTAAQRADLARIQRSKQHLLVLIDDLFDLARLEAGQLTVQLAPLSLQDVLLDVEALMASQIASKGLHLDTSGCATAAFVRADRDKLCKVLTNLVTNALRFTDPGGTIRIDCESAPPDVRVCVTDTGIGIPEQHREAIFEPFTQVDTGLTRRADGTGLGLAISRQLTEAMGGTLTVESVLGVGSTFVVSLPLVPRGALAPGLDLPARRDVRGEREAHDMA